MLLAIFVIIASFFITAEQVFAVNVSISNTPTTISDQPFSLDISISGASAGTNYLKIDLYKDATTNYFGDTYNGNSWYNGSDGKQYFPITIVSGQTWSGSLQGRIGSPSSTEFPSSGSYKLKIRRYTGSGNVSSGDQQTPQDITITYSIPTSTPTPTSTATPTPTNTVSSFTISNVPIQTDSDKSFSVSVNLSLPSSPNTKFYFKGAFKKSDSSNYFGLTKVNGTWIKNNDTYSN